MPDLTGGLIGSWDIPRWDIGAWDETVSIAEQISFEGLAYTQPFVVNTSAFSITLGPIQVTKQLTGLVYGQALLSFPAVNVIPPLSPLAIITQITTNAPINVLKSIQTSVNAVITTNAPITVDRLLTGSVSTSTTSVVVGMTVIRDLRSAATAKGTTSSATLDVEPSFIASLTVQILIFSSINVIKLFNSDTQALSVVNSSSLLV